MRWPRFIALVAFVVLFSGPEAFAYIGPGAGFAFAGSALVLVTTFLLAFGVILLFPLRLVWRLVATGNPFKNARVKRVVILGLDGMDPGITTKFMREGKLPNLQRLADKGVFRPLGTSYPSMSPVAWSSFTTGVDPSHHNIYDFLTRDPCTYMPMLSSTDISSAKRVLNIGKFVVPLPGTKASIKLLQKGQAFWKVLGERNVTSTIQRVPITFPPVPFKGMLLSGMCVPDLRGSQGTFGFFSTQSSDGHAAFTGGEQTVLRRTGKGDRIRTRVMGPDAPGGGNMTLPMTIVVAPDKQSATLEFDDVDETYTLKVGEYSPWVTLPFKAGRTAKAYGIARFYFNSLDPEVNLYHTPIHIDPENPAMPISHPSVYAIYLAKKLGKFATLGLAEDTWALNERVIDEKAFFEQAMLIADERVDMFKDALSKQKKGLITCVFDTTDRIQHMFYRYLDPDHPANEGRDTEQWKDAIERVYKRMDDMIGEMWDELVRDDTCFMVISDHGFTNFRRGVNLNAWLRDEGYLFLKDDSNLSGDWFANVDWSRTKAFSLGLTGMFINRKGREASGIVEEGAEYDALVAELIAKLKELRDPKDNRKAVLDVFAATDFFEGPHRFDAPDLIIGYDGGFRNSWDCATGSVPAEVFSDNTKSWSGDHCVDPRIVPGVFFSSHKIDTETPTLLDMAPSVMKLFGQTPPDYMQGTDIYSGESVAGPLDPKILSQSGSAPGARIFPEQAPAGDDAGGAPADPAAAPASPDATP